MPLNELDDLMKTVVDTDISSKTDDDVADVK